MSRIGKRSRYTAPFVMVALIVNGFLFCLGALSGHSSAVTIIYVLAALLNFVGSWKVGSDWRKHRRASEEARSGR